MTRKKKLKPLRVKWNRLSEGRFDSTRGFVIRTGKNEWCFVPRHNFVFMDTGFRTKQGAMRYAALAYPNG